MDRLRLLLDAETALAREAWAPRGDDAAEGEALAGELGIETSALGRSLPGDRDLRERLLAAWVARRGEEAGRRWSGIHRGLGAALLVLSFLLGAATAQAALWTRTDGSIDLWRALGLMFALPFLFLLLTLAALGLQATRGQARSSGFTSGLLALQRGWWARRLGLEAGPELLARTAPHERRRWMRKVQAAAVAFQLGLAVLFLLRLWFSDLQFSWATTAEAGGEGLLPGVTALLAAPWAWLVDPSLLPDEALIEATRRGALGVDASDRRWWPFLLGSLLAWGLLPRLLLLGFAHRALRRGLAGLAWNHRGYQALYARLFPPLQPESGPTMAIDASPLTAAPGRMALAWGAWWPAADHPGLAAADAPLPRLGLDAEALLHAGSASADEEEARARLAAAPPQELWLLVEAGETPDKRLLRFLRTLRETLGASVPLQVLPCEWRAEAGADGHWPAPAARDLEVWSRTLATLHDDHLMLHRPAL